MLGREVDEEFREWALASRAGLRRTAFLLCGNWFLADDLVQDTLVRMYLAWPRVARSGALVGYSRRVLVNLYLDYRRRPARRERPTPDVPELAGHELAGIGYRDQLLSALRQVPRGQRAVLVLRFWEDLSIEQTAQALGTSPGNVKSQTSRGLATLRAALAAHGLADMLSLEEQP